VWGCDASDSTFCVVFAVMGQDLKFILQLILLGKMKIVIFLVVDKKKVQHLIRQNSWQI